MYVDQLKKIIKYIDTFYYVVGLRQGGSNFFDRHETESHSEHHLRSDSA